MVLPAESLSADAFENHAVAPKRDNFCRALDAYLESRMRKGERLLKQNGLRVPESWIAVKEQLYRRARKDGA